MQRITESERFRTIVWRLTMPKHVRPYVVEVLLVEDNPDDAFLAREAIHDGAPNCNLTHVEDGVEAMAFLRGEGKHADAPTPHVVLLDINLPRKNGLEVLREMK